MSAPTATGVNDDTTNNTANPNPNATPNAPVNAPPPPTGVPPAPYPAFPPYPPPPPPPLVPGQGLYYVNGGHPNIFLVNQRNTVFLALTILSIGGLFIPTISSITERHVSAFIAFGAVAVTLIPLLLRGFLNCSSVQNSVLSVLVYELIWINIAGAAWLAAGISSIIFDVQCNDELDRACTSFNRRLSTIISNSIFTFGAAIVCFAYFARYALFARKTTKALARTFRPGRTRLGEQKSVWKCTVKEFDWDDALLYEVFQDMAARRAAVINTQQQQWPQPGLYGYAMYPPQPPQGWNHNGQVQMGQGPYGQQGYGWGQGPQMAMYGQQPLLQEQSVNPPRSPPPTGSFQDALVAPRSQPTVGDIVEESRVASTSNQPVPSTPVDPFASNPELNTRR